MVDGCDALYVCTWTSEHRRLVEMAVAARRHVFCEKPLSTDLAGATAMADLAPRARASSTRSASSCGAARRSSC